MQPPIATSVSLVGVVITAAISLAVCATGANQMVDLETAGRFYVEVAKAFTAGICAFNDRGEYERIVSLYGSCAISDDRPEPGNLIG
tara:strand:- start:151 stop:411 length:261 start_codon:yes stop_codon:yes gene_type:complete